MAWSKFDDRYDDNRKIKKAWRASRASVGLHAMAITYCSRHETDGLVDVEWLIEKLPQAKERNAAVSALVDAGLFAPVDGEMFQVKDYLEFNPSSAKLAEKRRKDSERKRGGFHADSERNPNGSHAESGGIPS
jgi:hypothetical protein